MSESYTAVQVDSRTFGDQVQRLLNDLNRPDLQTVAQQYLQDAMRYFQRMPFFFSDIDNTTVPAWAASTIYPQGSTIQMTLSGDVYTIVASNTGTSGTVTPSFTTDIFDNPGSNEFPPPTVGTDGTTQDNDIIWLTVENSSSAGHTSNYWTQLSTVYSTNAFTPPLDYVAPRLVEITTATMRYPLIELSYPELRSYDVIRPSPVTTYPTYWAWFEQMIFLWPYANGEYPITLSYRAAPQLAVLMSTSNFWTTKAEALVRNYAQGLIQQSVMKDLDAAGACFAVADREFMAIRSQGISQTVLQGIPPDTW